MRRDLSRLTDMPFRRSRAAVCPGRRSPREAKFPRMSALTGASKCGLTEVYHALPMRRDLERPTDRLFRRSRAVVRLRSLRAEPLCEHYKQFDSVAPAEPLCEHYRRFALVVGGRGKRNSPGRAPRATRLSAVLPWSTATNRLKQIPMLKGLGLGAGVGGDNVAITYQLILISD
ncbi:hypothetical protein XM38_016780 [Halomicronema hongdechloris C2206]|uniref:Uncharacterized protein n=1 Tax=Halomicronema hongdechloris C2206 TaxID=1641165 RepID=A0A1Z3HKA9_9CYAN|nr:hypothetical protein XM38_016780 [Halomicronema hongdechloris C2206]